MKIKFSVFVADGGDGSIHVRLFKTHTQAQEASDKDEEKFGTMFTDGTAVTDHTIEIDEDGNIFKINGKKV